MRYSKRLLMLALGDFRNVVVIFCESLKYIRKNCKTRTFFQNNVIFNILGVSYRLQSNSWQKSQQVVSLKCSSLSQKIIAFLCVNKTF